MGKIFEIWWSEDTKTFSITNYRRWWKELGYKPRLCIHENGGRRKKGDRCFDISVVIGYTVFNYVNFTLQRRRGRGK